MVSILHDININKAHNSMIQLLKIKLIICVNVFSGFIISVMCKNHTMANYSALGVFLPLLLLGGESILFISLKLFFTLI